MTEIDKSIVDCFLCISDENYQARSWFGVGEELSSSDEILLHLDSLDFYGSWWPSRQKALSDSLNRAIRLFVTGVERFPGHGDDFEEFSSLEWIQLRLRAKLVYVLLCDHFQITPKRRYQ